MKPESPSDILADRSLKRRTFFNNGFMSAVIPLGKLTKHHTLLIPRRDCPPSIGYYMDTGVSWEYIEDAIRTTDNVVKKVSKKPLFQVIFEHGNTGQASVSRYGIHIGMMHSVWTADRASFEERLEEKLKEEKEWSRIDSWLELKGIHNHKEYLFIQTNHDFGNIRFVKYRRSLDNCHLARIVYECLDESRNKRYGAVWRLVEDKTSAINEARKLSDVLNPPATI